MSALMSQFDIARESLNTALNDSEGSAERELSNYQKGIDYSIEKFKASFQEFSTSVLSSDVFKAVVDGGTEFLGILTKITEALSPLGTALATLGGFKFVKSISQPKFLAVSLL